MHDDELPLSGSDVNIINSPVTDWWTKSVILGLVRTINAGYVREAT